MAKRVVPFDPVVVHYVGHESLMINSLSAACPQESAETR
jgi:hypothetical protein